MKMCIYYVNDMNRDFSRDELEPAAAVYLILIFHSPGCCCLTSWIWRDINGSLISDTLFSCKWCSGPLICMTPTQDISSRLVSERLAVSRPNQSFLLFNRLLAVGELHRFWKVFIGVCWKFSFGKFQTRLSVAGVWETQEIIGNEVAVYTMAVEMKDKTSGYLVFTQGGCSDILSAYLTGVDGICPADW